jgi:hypothetical protein
MTTPWGSILSRVKGLVAGGLMGVITSWMIVGGYVFGIGYALEHVGRSCRLTKHLTSSLQDGLVVIGLAVSVLLIGAFLIESRKHRGVPEVGEWGWHMFVLWLWFIGATCVLFVLLAVWLGCSTWYFFR